MKKILIGCLLLGTSLFFTSCEKEVIVVESPSTVPVEPFVPYHDYWGTDVALLLEPPQNIYEEVYLNTDGSHIVDGQGYISYLTTTDNAFCPNVDLLFELRDISPYPILVEYEPYRETPIGDVKLRVTRFVGFP